ncbi:MAG TPA: ComEC/Rec2 family competence protein [Pyrinomonadaceae bacterium]|jgi:competence protein ComEC
MALAHPLAVLAASFALGVLGARFIPLPLQLVLACAAACTIFAAYCFVKRRERAASLLLVLAFCNAGATLMSLEKRGAAAGRVEEFYDGGVIKSGDPVEVTGVLERDAEPAPDGFYFVLKVERLRFKEVEREASGRVMLFAPARDGAAREEYEALELRYGARVRVMAALRRSDQFRNPGVGAFTEYLEQRDLDAAGTIKSPLLVERLDDERVFLPLAWLYEWRQLMLSEIDARFSPCTGGVLKAALLGNRYQLSRDAAEGFREGGTFHVLVISGAHISFIGGLVLLLMRRVTRRRAWQFGMSVAFLWAYTLAVGAEASVVRAAWMFTLVALAPVLHRRANSLNALGGATLLLLVRRPADLFDPSFQLTFLSVLAIVALGWPLLEKLREVGQWRPTRATPYPPRAPHALRLLSEALFWSEREWRREVERSNYSYKLFKTPLAARLERMRLQRALRYSFTALVVSASVQLTLLPLLVLYFHRLSLAALLLNIVVGALMALLALAAVAALLLSHLSVWLAAPLFKLAEGLCWLMTHSVDPFTALGVASVRLPEYTNWPSVIYFAYYAPPAALAYALARWQPLNRHDEGDEPSRAERLLKPRYASATLLLLCTLIVRHPLSAGRPDGRLRIDFLDVGQGDAALVTMPDGTTLLVDAGGRPDFARRGAHESGAEETFERDTRGVGEAVVSEYLWWRGLDHVDYVLATHADADHIDGLNDVARNFRVRAALVARAPTDDEEFARFSATARSYDLPVRLVGRGDRLRFGAVQADVLWPTRSLDPNAPSGNDDSLVLRLRYGQRTFLLTGDIERRAEAALTSEPAGLRSDVVKVAHHGSKTSSTQDFVAAARTSYAVISVGLASVFGHPHKEVVERWRASGAQVLTTGERGTITVSTDGHDLKVETFIK